MNCKGANKNSKNLFNEFNGGKSPPRAFEFKHLFPFAVILISLLLAIGTASATITIKGDLASGEQSNIYVFEGTAGGTNPCSGTGSSDSNTLIAGDLSYDDDDDYTLSWTPSVSPVDVNVWFCDTGGNKKANFTKNVTDGTTLYVDLGRVAGNTHDDLDSDYVFVCTDFNGIQLNSEEAQVDAVNNNFTQYYAFEDGVSANNQVYVFFDNDNTRPCAWDNTKTTGRRIDTTSALAYENYGIAAAFAPTTKAQGYLHADFNYGYMRVFNSYYGDGNSDRLMVGMAKFGVLSGAVGDRYTLYYDANTDAGAKVKVQLIKNPDPSTTRTISDMNILQVPATFTSLDANIKINGDVPTEIDKVTSMINGVDYQFEGLVNEPPKDYNLYVPISTPTLNFEANGVVEYKYTYGGTQNSDQTLKVGRVSGEAHPNLESSTAGIRVFTDSNCQNAVTQETGDPDWIRQPTDDAGDDYNIYFTDDATDYYLQVWYKNSGFDYNSCGNHFTLTNQGAHKDLNIQVTGTVPDTNISVVAIDLDQDGVDDVNTVTMNSGVYYMFTGSDNAADLMFFSGPYLNNTKELSRTKDLTSASTTVNVAMISGSTHAKLNDGDAQDQIKVYSDANCTTLLSSESEEPLAANTPDYNQYYESSGAGTYYIGATAAGTYYIGATALDKGTAYTSCIKFSGSGNGASDNINIDRLVDGNVHVDIARVGIDWTTADGVNDVNADVDGTGYLIFTPSASAGANAKVRFFNSSGKLLLSRTKDLSSAGTTDLNVANVGGEAHSIIEDGSSTIAVYSGFDPTTGALSGLVSSETVHPTDSAGTDYNQYFEYSGIDQNYFIKVTVVKNGVSYDTNGNVFMVDSNKNRLNNFTAMTFNDFTDYTIDLTVNKDGNVTSDIYNVGIDYNQDGAMEAFAQVHGGQYYLIAQPDTDGVDVNFYDRGRNSVFGTSRASISAGTVSINVSKVYGELPSGFEGDNAYLQFDTNACTIDLYGDFNAVAATLTGTPDYTLYYDANGTDYNVVFCDDDHNAAIRELTELYVSFTSDSNGGVEREISVGNVKGEAHDNLETNSGQTAA